MIKTVFFDLDDTLYDFTKGDRAGTDAVKARYLSDLGITPAEFDRLHAECMRDLESEMGINNASVHNRQIRYQLMLKKLGLPWYPLSGRMASLYWETLIRTMEPEPGILAVLKSLRAKGIRTGLGSNMTSEVQYRKCDKIGVGPYLDYFITSEHAGYEKPDSRFFFYCAETAGVAPEECLFIGDNYPFDVQGSSSAGMHGVLYCPPRLRRTDRPLPDDCTVLSSYADWDKVISPVI